MLENYRSVWAVFGGIISALPSDLVVVGVTIFCFVGIVGVLRSL